MSINMDDDSGTDYSDFEYQTISAQLQLFESDDSTGNTSAAATGLVTFEPLGGIGGLDNNEVAELVYVETYAALEHEDESADQDVGTSTEFRGNLGVNLPATDAALVDTNRVGGPSVEGQLIEANDIAEDNVEVVGDEGTDDRRLQHFKVVGGPPFDDQTNGPGGSNFSTVWHSEKAYRQMVGRGPVLDSNDDITVALRAAAEDTVIDYIGDFKAHLVWDVAETSDAGRRFSVPMDD